MEILIVAGMYLVSLAVLSWINAWATNFTDNRDAFVQAFFNTTCIYIFLILALVTFGAM